MFYGIYADDSFAPRPVWLMRIPGPGVNICICDGGPTLSSTGQVMPSTSQYIVTHRDVVVLDARTGLFLEEQTESNMPALGRPLATLAPRPSH